jgi:hypothetical protein
MAETVGSGQNAASSLRVSYVCCSMLLIYNVSQAKKWCAAAFVRDFPQAELQQIMKVLLYEPKHLQICLTPVAMMIYSQMTRKNNTNTLECCEWYICNEAVTYPQWPSIMILIRLVKVTHYIFNLNIDTYSLAELRRARKIWWHHTHTMGVLMTHSVAKRLILKEANGTKWGGTYLNLSHRNCFLD